MDFVCIIKSKDKIIIGGKNATDIIYLLGYSLDLANKKTAFFVVGIILIVSSIVHTITLIFSKEKPVELKEKVNLKENIKSLFTNKEFLKVILIFCVWYLVNYGVFYLALGWNGRYINIAY